MSPSKKLIAKMIQSAIDLEVIDPEWQPLSREEEEICLAWAADSIPHLIPYLKEVKEMKHFTDYDDVLRLCSNTWLSSGSIDLLVSLLLLIDRRR